MYVYMRTYTHTHVHTYIHKYTYIHTTPNRYKFQRPNPFEGDKDAFAKGMTHFNAGQVGGIDG